MVMQTRSGYQRPFDDVIFGALSRLCREIALIVKDLGAIDPKLTGSYKAKVNDYFRAAEYNVAMIPEELIRDVTDFSGGCLYALGSLLGDPFVSPVVISPMARTAVENSSLIIYLNSFDPIERTFWSMRALQQKIQYEKEKDLIPGLFGPIDDAVKVYTSMHKGRDLKFPSNTKLVSDMLKDICGADLYKMLSSYSHHNAWTALKHYANVKYDPVLLEIQSVFLVVDTLESTIKAAHSIEGFRPRQEYDRNIELLNELIPYLKVCETLLLEWIGESRGMSS